MMLTWRTLIAVIAFASATAACAPSNQIAPGVTAVSASDPIAPGSVRFSMENPDKEKWVPRIRQGAPDGSVRYGFTCQVLSCPEPATVIISNSRSAVTRPDPKALEKLAKESIPKMAQARNLELQVRTDNKGKIETLSSNVTRYKDYPAILVESKITVTDRVRHIAVATVFAGRVLVNVNAEAGDRATAKTAAEAFANSFKVEEGPPL
jgi:hypothetical protein